MTPQTNNSERLVTMIKCTKCGKMVRASRHTKEECEGEQDG